MSTKSRSISSFLVALAVSVATTGAATADSLSAFPGSLASGSSAYASIPTGDLNGVIEYAVFTEAAFESNWPAFDVPAGELAYVYQVLNGDPSDAVSSNAIININNSITSIDSFTIDPLETETAPQTTTLVPGSVAQWSFAGTGNNIPSGGRSNGLILTSPNLPNGLSIDIVVNGGQSAQALVLVPGDVPIPEPTSVALAFLPLMGLMARRSR